MGKDRSVTPVRKQKRCLKFFLSVLPFLPFYKWWYLSSIGVKRRFTLAISPLIVVCALLFHGTTAKAGDTGDTIGPNFDFVTLLEGQSATIGVTQEIPVDVHTVCVTSLGNKTMSAKLQNITKTTRGISFLYLIGTGRRTLIDVAFGIVPWDTPSAEIDISEGISFGLATGTLFLTPPVSAEEPVTYQIKIN